MTGVFEDHLSLDAVVAYVDSELSLPAFQRAAHHLHECPDCAREVAEQAAAARVLRGAGGPSLPAGLLSALRAIPAAPASPEQPALGRSLPLALPLRRTGPGHDGVLPTLPSAARSRRSRLGAGALVAGLAVGALATGAYSDRATPVRTPPPVSSSVNSSLRAPGAPVGQVRSATLSHRR